MLRTQQDLCDIITSEIADRTETEAEKAEIDALLTILTKVQQKADLSYPEYEWLCDLVSAADQE